MSWIAAIADVFIAGVRKPRAAAIDFLGAGVSYNYNETTRRHEITITGGGGGGSGDVVGPASSVDDRLALFSGITGKLLKQSTFLIADVIKRNGGTAFTADQSMGGFKLTSLGAPTASTDATTKAYVDAEVAGAGVTDHGALTGLSDDDHPQYALADGSRAFTGGVTVTQAAVAGGTPLAFRVTGGAHTASVASAEVVDVDFGLNRTVQFATGALPTQRAVRFRAPTYGFVGASVITDAATVCITGAPAAGTNATITNSYALWIQAGSVRLQALGAGVVKSSGAGVLSSAPVDLASADVTGVLPASKGGSTPGVDGGNLTNANTSKAITDGNEFTLPASTLAASAKTLTLLRTGTPKTGEHIYTRVFAQALDYTVKNDDSAGGLTSTFVVTAGEKWLVDAEWMGADWLVLPLKRLP